MTTRTILFLISLALAAGCERTGYESPLRSAQSRHSPQGIGSDLGIARLRAMNAEVDIRRDQVGGAVVSIDLSLVSEVTSALRIATSLPQIDRLSLENVELNAVDIELLRKLPSLRWLNLAHTTVDDEQLAFLESTPQLEFLILWATDVSDSGLQHMASLSKLEKLDLSATKVTGAGLSQLAALTSLLELYVEVPNIEDEDIARLQEKLPETLIVH
jgi:hypothetical protein